MAHKLIGNIRIWAPLDALDVSAIAKLSAEFDEIRVAVSNALGETGFSADLGDLNLVTVREKKADPLEIPEQMRRK